MTGRANRTVCYDAIQHTFRPAVVDFVRERFVAQFGERSADELKRALGKSWSALEARERDRRSRTESNVAPRDAFDLLDVASFHNLFESGRGVLLPALADRQFMSMLRRIDLIKAHRDAFSHPNAAALPYNEAFTLLCEAERVLVTLGLPAAAAAMIEAQAELSGSPKSVRRSNALLQKERRPKTLIVVGAGSMTVAMVGMAALFLLRYAAGSLSEPDAGGRGVVSGGARQFDDVLAELKAANAAGCSFYLKPGERWDVGFLYTQPSVFDGTSNTTRVCMRLTGGAQKCWQPSSRYDPLAVVSEDLDRRETVIEVMAGNQVVASWTGPRKTPLCRNALCQGMKANVRGSLSSAIVFSVMPPGTRGEDVQRLLEQCR